MVEVRVRITPECPVCGGKLHVSYNYSKAPSNSHPFGSEPITTYICEVCGHEEKMKGTPSDHIREYVMECEK